MRDLTVLAAQFALGIYTEDQLLELLGEGSLVKEVIAMSGGVAVANAASDVVEDVVDTTLDILDDLNPFNW